MAAPRVSLVPIDRVPHLWPQVEKHLAPAMPRLDGCYELTDILCDILRGSKQLWVAVDGDAIEAAVVTEFYRYPRKTYLNVFIAGGRGLSAWHRPMFALLERFGRDNGAVAMSATGRKGWTRVVGATITGFVGKKDLS